jgi:ribose transport system permease protein
MSVRRLTLEMPALVRLVRRWQRNPTAVLAVLLVLLFGFASVFIHGFFAEREIPVVLSTVTILGLFAIGQQLPLLTAGIDLSATALAVAAGFVAAGFSNRGGAIAIAAALAFGLLVGLANGAGVGFLRVHPLIMTLGMSGVLVGGVLVYTSTASQITSTPPNLLLHLGEAQIGGVVPTMIVVWVAVCVLVALLLRTRLGDLIYAVGSNQEACRLAGIRVPLVQLAVYGIAGVIFALAGLLFAGYASAVIEGSADVYLLPSIATVVLGGTSIFGGFGRVSGTVLATLLVAILQTVLILVNAVGAGEDLLFGIVLLVVIWAFSRMTQAT